ncbi:hypothetical protein GGQ73_003805 [Rhizobium skierniewicense]|uniref:Uncharacterized protein n=1 Tax=Rhizobium skierniewicense TaxID=984260 RepID=A0A7W6CE77_9HYPH|nr:hypothetical protein [Rhizobium skierniewicense]
MRDNSKGAGSSRTCFVVGPIGASNTQNRIHADWLLDGIIVPTFEGNFPDFKGKRQAETVQRV